MHQNLLQGNQAAQISSTRFLVTVWPPPLVRGWQRRVVVAGQFPHLRLTGCAGGILRIAVLTPNSSGRRKSRTFAVDAAPQNV